MLQLDVLSRDVLDRLHPSAVEDSSAIRALMVRLWRESVSLRRGVNRQITPEVARIERVDSASLHLRLDGFEPSRRSQLWLNFELDSLPYFFAAHIMESSDERAVTHLPELVYRAERRDRVREATRSNGRMFPERITLEDGTESIDARVADQSAGGLGLEVPSRLLLRVGTPVALRFTDASGERSSWRGSLRHLSPSASGTDWQKIGVSLLGPGIEHSHLIEPARTPPSWKRARRTWEAVAAGAAAQSERLVGAVIGRTEAAPTIHVLDFESSNGENVRAIANWSRQAESAPAPVILVPPAWGRTKETLLPLASTIVETFERANQPVIVVRFDGIRRRGESHNDPECSGEGLEHHHFTFSQGVEDIRTVIDGLKRRTDLNPTKTVLVTFSAASIDGRRAVASDAGEICGWVSVVGSADLQSMMRVVSGGVDFVAGLERGVSFGRQEILGVEVDIDRAAIDAIDHRMAFLEDSCRDMEQIRVPVTWIHGRHDAWMDLERSRLMLSCGDTSNRKLVIVPTGHQLRTSREALEVFQLIAQEVSRLCLGRELTPRIPNLVRLESRRRAERSRLPRKSVDRRAFWKRYLLGRQGSVGIELMTYSSQYRSFMMEQIGALDLQAGQKIADFGSGTGAFVSSLAGARHKPIGLTVVEFDHVTEALTRARERIGALASAPCVSFVACDLAGEGTRLSIPIADHCFDAALASLFISYVNDPITVLGEIYRVLKPGGRLVVSGLRKDADVSKLFVEATEEIAHGGGISLVPEASAVDFQQASRDFLNDATRLVDLEELGIFEFRDGIEMAGLLESAGFRVDKVWRAFGDPPQSVVVSAHRPA